MRNQVPHLAVTIGIAALAVACSRPSTNTVNNDRRQQSGGDRGKYEEVKLEGCVQAAPGVQQFVLMNVVNAPATEQPRGSEMMAHGHIVPDGSWVRLTAGGENVRQYLGKKVSVIGRIVDRGDNTIGTSGSSNPDTASTPDRAQPLPNPLPRGANANGNAPAVAAEHITKLADTCSAEQDKAREGHTGREQGGRAPKEDNPGPGSHR